MIKLIFNIALKFILYKIKGRLGFVRKTFYLGAIGLTLSILSLILLNSVENGYKYNLKTRLLELESDIEIVSNNNESSSLTFKLIQSNSKKGFKSFCTSFSNPSIIKYLNYSEGVEIVSYQTDDCNLFVKKGNVVLGSKLKDKLKVNIDDKVLFVNPFILVESLGLNKKSTSLNVQSFSESGTPDDRYLVVMHPDDFLSIYPQNSKYSTINTKIYLNDSSEQDFIEEYIDKYQLDAYIFNEKYENVYNSLDQVFEIISIILYFFMALAIINITSSIWLIVESKRNQIRFLILAGLSKKQISLVFIIVSLIMVVSSFVIAFILSALIIFIQNNYEIISISSNVYIISKLEGVIDYSYLAYLFLVFISLGALFSSISSLKSIYKRNFHV